MILFIKKNCQIIISSFIFFVSFISCEPTLEPTAFGNVHDHLSSNFIPDVPSDLVLFQKSDKHINIHWQNNSNYGTFFRIERKDSAGDFKIIGEVNIDTLHFADTSGILKSTTYYYRIGTIVANGNIGYSENSPFSLLFSGPTNLSAQDSQRTNIILNWDYDSDFENGFVIERKRENEDFIEIGRTDKTIKTFIDNMLDTNYVYSYRVRAFTDINYSDPSPDIQVDFIPDCLQLGMLVSGPSAHIVGFVFSPDGEIMALKNLFSKEIRLHSARTGEFIKVLVSYSDEPGVFCFSSNGEMLAVSIADRIDIWDIFSNQLITSLQFSARRIVFSDDGLYLAANSVYTNNVTKLFSTSSWNLIREFEGNAGVDFSPDGLIIGIGSNTSSTSKINLWNVSDGSLFNVINKPYANSFVFKFDASGKYIFGSDRDYIYGFEILGGNNVFKTQPIAGYWYSIDTDPLGRTFFAGGTNGRAILWRIKDFQISRLSGLSYSQTAYNGQYTPDGSKIAILNDDGINLWSLNYRWIQVY